MGAEEEKIIHKELSYRITGLLFEVHNALGRFCREKQYGDALEDLLKKDNIIYNREKSQPIEIIDNKETNKVDFIIDNAIVVELKAKEGIVKEDYRQIQRYLQASGKKLGLLVNFNSKFLRPIRIIRIDS